MHTITSENIIVNVAPPTLATSTINNTNNISIINKIVNNIIQFTPPLKHLS